jgi:hypothetical protein
MWHESVAIMQTYRVLSYLKKPALWPRDMVALCAVMAQPGQHSNLSHRTPHRSCSSRTSVTKLRSLIWPKSSSISDIVVFQVCSDASCIISLTRIDTRTGSTSTKRTSQRVQEATPRTNMEEIASLSAHTCAHCVDIVFPGSTEEIYVAYLGPPEDRFGNLDLQGKTLSRLGISLADLRLRANAGCDFAQYLKDDIEDRMYKDADPDAIQLYIRLENYPRIIIEPLICLQGLHIPHDIFGGKDISRCFVTAASKGLGLCIFCFVSDTSGKSFAY